MVGFCGNSPLGIQTGYIDVAIEALRRVPGIELPNNADVRAPPPNVRSQWERTAITAFENIVDTSDPNLVNVDTAAFIIATFMLLMNDTTLFRLLVAIAMRTGRFVNMRFESRLQVDNVLPTVAQDMMSLYEQRLYIQQLTPQTVFLYPNALQTSDYEQVSPDVARTRHRSRLTIDVSSYRREGNIYYINVPVMLDTGFTWNRFLRFMRLFVERFTDVVLMNNDPSGRNPSSHDLRTISNAIMEEFMNAAGTFFNYFMVDLIFTPSMNFDFLLPVMRHRNARNYIQRIANLAFRVDFDEPLNEQQSVGGVVHELDYTRLHVYDRLPWLTEELRTAVTSAFDCLMALLMSLKRTYQIEVMEANEVGDRKRRDTSEFTFDRLPIHADGNTCSAGVKTYPTCAISDNLNIVYRQLYRTVNKGEFRKQSYTSWYQYFSKTSWDSMRDEGAYMAGRTCTGFFTCTYENYGFVFNDGSFSVGLTDLSILDSDRDNWIFENNNKHFNWHDNHYNGQIFFDREGRPVSIVIVQDYSIPRLWRTVWVYEFTEDDTWVWSYHEWEPRADELSRNKGPWTYSLTKRRIVTKTNDPWSLDELHLASTQDIVDMHCKDDNIDSHYDWVSFYDDMHMANFDTLRRVQFIDGSFALGITNPERTSYNHERALITDFWTVPKVHRNEEKDDFDEGPYYGILVIDRQGRPVFAALRENWDYVSFHYHINGTWRWETNEKWKNIAGDKHLSLDPEAPRFKLSPCKSM